MSVSVKPPSGTRDFLPADVIVRREVIEAIRTTYERYGFAPLETPALERLDVLTGKYGDEGDQLMFKVLKRGEKLPELTDGVSPNDLCDLALRYDLTVPLARVVAAHHGKLPRFFKRYQIQPVWRADRPQRGRFREFYQCDVDFAGTESVVAEATVISAVRDALGTLGFHEFVVHVNDRRVLTGLMEVAEIPEELRGPALVAIDKLDKIGVDGVLNELRNAGITHSAIESLSRTVLDEDLTLDGLAAVFGEASAVGGEASAVGNAGTETLQGVFALLEAAPDLAGTVRFDASLARGLSYYTGPIFEIRIDGMSGSIGGGGRYDGLVGMFRGTQIPSVGFSLGLERILVLMADRGMAPDGTLPPDLYIAHMDAETVGESFALAQALRAAGFRADMHPESAKLGKQFAYAESLGARFVALLGKREVEAGAAQVKDLHSGEQHAVPVGDLPAWLAAQA